MTNLIFDFQRPTEGFDGAGERHVQREDVVTMRVDETDEWIAVPLRSVFVDDGLTGWSFEIGPYSISGSDAATLINALADYGIRSADFHPKNGTIR